MVHIAMPQISDFAAVSLSGGKIWFYFVVRPVRLAKKYMARLAAAILLRRSPL
jgi:hypothetical protein